MSEDYHDSNNFHGESVEWPRETVHAFIPKGCEMCLLVLGLGDSIGTNVHLDATDPEWQAHNLTKWITYCLKHWTRVRLQALTFHGETLFDFRLWPEPPGATVQLGSCEIPEWMIKKELPVLEPITVEVRQPHIPEWENQPSTKTLPPRPPGKCRFCGDIRPPLDEWGYCEVCVEGMARTNGD